MEPTEQKAMTLVGYTREQSSSKFSSVKRLETSNLQTSGSRDPEVVPFFREV